MASATHAGAFTDGPAFEATLGEAHRYYIELKADALRRILRRRAAGARLLLDLGCGTGQMEEALTGRGYEITGVDLSPEMIAHANGKKIPRSRFVAADAARTGLPGGAFDAVFATALFHHVPPPLRPAVTNEMARLVRPGGLVVVFEHNPSNPVTRRMVRRSPVDRDAVLLHRRETVETLSSSGLVVEAVRHLVFFPPWLSAFSVVDRWMGRCAAGGQYVVVARKAEERGLA